MPIDYTQYLSPIALKPVPDGSTLRFLLSFASRLLELPRGLASLSCHDLGRLFHVYNMHAH